MSVMYIYIPSKDVADGEFAYESCDDTGLRFLYDKLSVETLEGVTLGKNQVMYIDDVGRLNGSPINVLASAVYNRTRGGDLICGDAVIFGYDNEGETTDVDPDMVALVAKLATSITTDRSF